jgi:membrane protein YdbS with pleckstrin-like domain
MSAEPTMAPSPGESASFWQLKPWWCQPWSILLTGVVAMLGSWLLLQRWWITAPLSLAVLLWWLLFLVLVPASYADQNKNL